MKETLYTIPLNDAFSAGAECPFCHIERKLEQDALDFMLGSAYMESDIREETDKTGFCRHHLQKMYDYGNNLGNALILSTHIAKTNRELAAKLSGYLPAKPSLTARFKKRSAETSQNAIADWLRAKENTCYLCHYSEETYKRYLDTFFFLCRRDLQFVEKIKQSKGFCLKHFADLMEASEQHFSRKEKETFYPLFFEVMQKNLKRIEDDISWYVDKFDYQNKDADWKNSRDAIPRTIQKLAGGYPADPPYKEKK